VLEIEQLHDGLHKDDDSCVATSWGSYKKNVTCLYEGADKSLARPGRKQATATKLWIYSTYSPWSSIQFL